MVGDGCGAKLEGAGNPHEAVNNLRLFKMIIFGHNFFSIESFRCCKREEQPLEEEEEVEQKDTGIP